MHIHNLIGSLPTGKKAYKQRSLAQIDTIVVHHSATKQGDARAFAQYHVGKGWPGIGYHFVLNKSGRAFKCNTAATISYHASGYNSRSLGICLVGDFDSEHPTPAQMDALIELCQELIRAYGIKRVVGHREVPDAHKSCPGANIDLETLRDAVFAGGAA